MPVDKQYFARWPRIYWGVQYDREQLVDFKADPHSPKGSQLLRLGYITETDARKVLPTCGVCGAQFSAEMWRDAHGDKQHAGRTRQAVGGAVRSRTRWPMRIRRGMLRSGN